MTKFYMAYVLFVVLGLFVGVTGTIGFLSNNPYYIGAAMIGILFSIVGIGALTKIIKKD